MTPFSHETAQIVFRDFPDWRAFSREERNHDGTLYLVVEVPPPAEANTLLGLVVSTDNDEVTVAFDYYHSHFDEWSSNDDWAHQYAALPFVQGLLSETIAVTSWWRGNEWRGSSQQLAGTDAEPDHITDFSRIRVRSWKGTFNDDRDA
jgi:hypothetical protein